MTQSEAAMFLDREVTNQARRIGLRGLADVQSILVSGSLFQCLTNRAPIVNAIIPLQYRGLVTIDMNLICVDNHTYNPHAVINIVWRGAQDVQCEDVVD